MKENRGVSIPPTSTNEELNMINTSKLAIASALCAGLLWVICSVLVVLFPNYMLQMTTHMIHVDITQMRWTLTWPGFLLGLFSWVIFAGVAGALLAVIYNRLVGNEVN